MVENISEMLDEQRGWEGTVERLVVGEFPVDPTAQLCDPFQPEKFACHELTEGFAVGLVFSVPEYLPDGAFRPKFGCRLEESLFYPVSILLMTAAS